MTYYFIIFIIFTFLSFYLAIRDVNKFQKKINNYNDIIQEIKELSEKIQKTDIDHIDYNNIESRSVNQDSVRLVFTKEYSLCNPKSPRLTQHKPYQDSLRLFSKTLKAKTYNLKKQNQFKNKYS